MSSTINHPKRALHHWARLLSRSSKFHLNSAPQCGAVDTEIVPSVENTKLKGSPFTAWSKSVYSHTCYTYCQGFLPCWFVPFGPFICIFPETSPEFVLCQLSWHWFLCAPAEWNRLPCWVQAPVSSARGIWIGSITWRYCFFVFSWIFVPKLSCHLRKRDLWYNDLLCTWKMDFPSWTLQRGTYCRSRKLWTYLLRTQNSKVLHSPE